MYAIIDKRCSKEIKENLKQYVDAVFEFSTEGITYNSISCHPDIFIFQNGKEGRNRCPIPHYPSGMGLEKSD